MLPAIKFEDVSKQYQLGEVGTGSIADDLHRAWARLRGKPDPLAKVGQVNDRTEKSSVASRQSSEKPTAIPSPSTDDFQLTTDDSPKLTANSSKPKRTRASRSEYVWALKDINFEVAEGEILGIIGRNGAGKSTLLKLLSRVTAPTTGSIKARGRIASLLEVGTGFHPELTGRENIYLNGTILGMRRHEITNRLDEIIEFSGCAKYIDTPVKRYSSGMTVRLGFAVAAHLDCEILVVDEVLAVGDAEFQKKCIGKMQNVSNNQGRTVIFVSHNLTVLNTLCKTCVVLKTGQISFQGETTSAIPHYLDSAAGNSNANIESVERSGNGEVKFLSYTIDSAVESGVEFKLKLAVEAIRDFQSAEFAVLFKDRMGTVLFTLFTKHSSKKMPVAAGKNTLECHVDHLPLAAGVYIIDLWCSSSADVESDFIRDAFETTVLPAAYFESGFSPTPNLHGPFLLTSNWKKC